MPSADASESAADAELSAPERDPSNDAVSIGDVEDIMGAKPMESIQFLSDMSHLALYPFYDLKVIETDVEDLNVGDITLPGEVPYSIASFKAGKKPTEFLLYYRMDDSTAIDILAVKEAGDTKDFLYIKDATK